MLGRPERVEAPLLERHLQLGRRDRIVGEENRRAKFHGFAPLRCSDRNATPLTSANKALQAVPFGSTGHYVMLTSKRHNFGWQVAEENYDEAG